MATKIVRTGFLFDLRPLIDKAKRKRKGEKREAEEAKRIYNHFKRWDRRGYAISVCNVRKEVAKCYTHYVAMS